MGITGLALAEVKIDRNNPLVKYGNSLIQKKYFQSDQPYHYLYNVENQLFITDARVAVWQTAPTGVQEEQYYHMKTGRPLSKREREKLVGEFPVKGLLRYFEGRTLGHGITLTTTEVSRWITEMKNAASLLKYAVHDPVVWVEVQPGQITFHYDQWVEDGKLDSRLSYKNELPVSQMKLNDKHGGKKIYFNPSYMKAILEALVAYNTETIKVLITGTENPMLFEAGDMAKALLVPIRRH